MSEIHRGEDLVGIAVIGAEGYGAPVMGGESMKILVVQESDWAQERSAPESSFGGEIVQEWA